MLDNILNILHISKPMTTLEINISITLTPMEKNKDKSKSKNTEGTQLVIDNDIYTQKAKSPYSKHHTHSRVLILPGSLISIRGQLVGEEAFSKIHEIIKILDLFLCPQKTAFVAQCV